MRKFTKFEISAIKRTAQNVNPMVTKKAKLKEQICELEAEYQRLSTMQEQYEASIKTMTGGYGTEDLVEKVIETTNSVDKTGKPIKVTKYVLKYPDTIVPPTRDLIASDECDTNAGYDTAADEMTGEVFDFEDTDYVKDESTEMF